MALVIVGVSVGLWYAYQPLQLGVGYGAKLVCSAVFTSGRSFERAAEEEVAMPIPIFSLSLHDQSVTCSTLFGLLSRTAYYDSISGSCTLSAPNGAVPYLDRPSTAPAVRKTEAPWPLGDAPDSGYPIDGINSLELEQIVKDAFQEPGEGHHRNTRAVVVLYKGKIAIESYAEGFTKDTRQLGWSMTKSILSTLVGFRVAEGAIHLNDTRLNPLWLEDPSDPRAQITLDELLRGE